MDSRTASRNRRRLASLDEMGKIHPGSAVEGVEWISARCPETSSIGRRSSDVFMAGGVYTLTPSLI